MFGSLWGAAPAAADEVNMPVKCLLNACLLSRGGRGCACRADVNLPISFLARSQAEPQREEGEDAASSSAKPAAGFNIWGVAAVVTQNLKAQVGEVVHSVKATDWTAELSSFRGGVSEETKVIKENTVKLAQHIPEVVAPLPGKASPPACMRPCGLHGMAYDPLHAQWPHRVLREAPLLELPPWATR
jgi:hypothetical protein